MNRQNYQAQDINKLLKRENSRFDLQTRTKIMIKLNSEGKWTKLNLTNITWFAIPNH